MQINEGGGLMFSKRGHGNGTDNHRTFNYRIQSTWNPDKLHKYLISRKYPCSDIRELRSVFMFQLQWNDIIIKELPLKEVDENE